MFVDFGELIDHCEGIIRDWHKCRDVTFSGKYSQVLKVKDCDKFSAHAELCSVAKSLLDDVSNFDKKLAILHRARNTYEIRKDARKGCINNYNE